MVARVPAIFLPAISLPPPAGPRGSYLASKNLTSSYARSIISSSAIKVTCTSAVMPESARTTHLHSARTLSRWPRRGTTACVDIACEPLARCLLRPSVFSPAPIASLCLHRSPWRGTNGTQTGMVTSQRPTTRMRKIFSRTSRTCRRGKAQLVNMRLKWHPAEVRSARPAFFRRTRQTLSLQSEPEQLPLPHLLDLPLSPTFSPSRPLTCTSCVFRPLLFFSFVFVLDVCAAFM